jgi:predicted HNH restriction endonuclease
MEFCRRIEKERKVCQACGRAADAAGQKHLHVHHLWPIAKSGLSDALATAACNVLLLCNYCHGLQHLAREYPWNVVGVVRGVRL